MPATSRETLLCRYHYDPLDRLVNRSPSAASDTQRFYCNDRLTNEVQGAIHTSLFQHDDQLLAQQSSGAAQTSSALLATDLQRSVLNVLDTMQLNALSYTAYGHRPTDNGLLSLLGFNGERSDPETGHYLLGNGYRAFNPVLMRFNSPDSLSPFGAGGINAYAYCKGDPLNRSDSTGHVPRFIKGFENRFGNRQRSDQNKLLKSAKKLYNKLADKMDPTILKARRVKRELRPESQKQSEQFLAETNHLDFKLLKNREIGNERKLHFGVSTTQRDLRYSYNQYMASLKPHFAVEKNLITLIRQIKADKKIINTNKQIHDMMVKELEEIRKNVNEL